MKDILINKTYLGTRKITFQSPLAREIAKKAIRDLPEGEYFFELRKQDLEPLLTFALSHGLTIENRGGPITIETRK